MSGRVPPHSTFLLLAGYRKCQGQREKLIVYVLFIYELRATTDLFRIFLSLFFFFSFLFFSIERSEYQILKKLARFSAFVTHFADSKERRVTLQRESASQRVIFLQRKQISRKASEQLFYFLFHAIVGNYSLKKKLDLLYLTREKIPCSH